VLIGGLGRMFRTAERLYVHPNTVRYRLRRIQTLTERSLENPADVAVLRTALLAYEMIPELTPE
jgi:DNA-binding PucR family transcriptional regulator